MEKYKNLVRKEATAMYLLGGENEEATKVNSSDLFWPMKHELKGYFKFIENAHNGSVNTYSLWIVTMLIVVTILSFIFL